MNAVFCVLFLGMLSLSKAISATESPTGCVSSFAGGNTCSPDDVVLHDFPQWQQTEGYWIGELTYEDALNKLACAKYKFFLSTVLSSNPRELIL